MTPTTCQNHLATDAVNHDACDAPATHVALAFYAAGPERELLVCEAHAAGFFNHAL